MTMTRRRLLDDTFKKSVVGNPAIAADSLARMYPGIVMEGWTTQDGTPTPEAPVPIVSAGTQNQETGKWEYEIEVGCGQLAEDSVVSHPEGEYVPDKIIFSGNIAGKYTISLEEVGEVTYAQPGSGIISITIDGKEEIIGKYQFPYTFIGNITEIKVFSSNSYIMFTGTINFMLNPGSTALPYTPYLPPQTVTLTADRPLTKWDRLEKRNGQWGWVYGSMEVTLNGSENWILYYAFNGFYLENILNGNYSRSEGFCNQFEAVTLGISDRECMWIGVANNTIYTVQNTFFSQGVQAWKDHLSQNPMTVIYKSNTETFIPLTPTEQEFMNALYTYRPTTVLSNQQDCQMTLTYKTRKGVGG